MALPTRLLAIGTVATVVALAPTASAAAAPTTPHDAGRYAAGQLARTLRATGGHLDYPAAYGGGTDWAGTVNAVLSLVANGVGSTAVAQATDYLAAHVDAYAKDGKGQDKPGALAGLLLVAHATGRDPHAFGGSDLVGRLQATEGAFTAPGASSPTPGLFGAQDPTYDGAYRQSLALLALSAAGVTPDGAAIGWLTGQQCADGGWTPYRADTTAACAAGNEDSNSTATATLALALLHVSTTADPLTFLHAIQDADGGFPFGPGSGTDANSTALVVQALLARGVDPTSWTKSSGTPWSALTHLQLGCSAPPAARGALDYQAETPLQANENATAQAATALAGAVLPVAPATVAASEPSLTCAAAPTPAATHGSAGTAHRPTTTAVQASGAAKPALVNTGAPVGRLAAGAAALLLAGGLLTIVGRRRQA